MARILAAFTLAVSLTACGTSHTPPVSGVLGPAVSVNEPVPEDYRIGPMDLLALNVFQVEALTIDEMRVDASGNIMMPLIGAVKAAGMTPAELAETIRTRLQANYMQDPRVSIRVSEAGNQKITVDGAVVEPGVYRMQGATSLMQAVAMAKGASGVANSRRVAVFRTIDGQRSVALFDLNAIRTGQASDPILKGDDVVVVDTSRLSVALRNIVSALPGLATFRAY